MAVRPQANFIPKPDAPHPTSGLTLPCVIGHEFSATVSFPPTQDLDVPANSDYEDSHTAIGIHWQIEEVGEGLQGRYKAGQKVNSNQTMF